MSGHWVRNEPYQVTAEFRRTKRTVRARSGGRCEIHTDGIRCPKPQSATDHIVPQSQGGSDAPENAQAICAPHHAAKSSREGTEALRARHARKYRPRPTHPGLSGPEE